MAEVRPIDANALKRTVYKIVPGLSNSNFFFKWACRWVVEVATTRFLAPTLDYEPVKHGTWIWCAEEGKWFCSACNKAAVTKGARLKCMHCFICGAKMDGGNTDA